MAHLEWDGKSMLGAVQLCICILLGVGSDSIRLALLLGRPSAGCRGIVILYACGREACLSRDSHDSAQY